MKEPSSRSEGIPVGHLAGFDVHAGVDRRFDEVSLTIPAGAEIRWATDEWRAVDPSSLVQRLERRIQNLDSALTEARGDQAASGQEAERARARIGAPFEHEDELRRLQRRQQEITEQLVPPPEEPPTLRPEASAAERMAARLASQESLLPPDSVDDLVQPAGRTMSMPTSAAASRVTMKRGARRPAEIGLAADCQGAYSYCKTLQEQQRGRSSRILRQANFSEIRWG